MFVFGFSVVSGLGRHTDTRGHARARSGLDPLLFGGSRGHDTQLGHVKLDTSHGALTDMPRVKFQGPTWRVEGEILVARGLA